MDTIRSTSNPRIKQIRALAQRKQRDATGLCVAEGIFHAGEALAAGEVTYLVFAPDLLISPFGLALVVEAEARGIPAYPATAEIMAAITEKENPQGLLVVAQQRRIPLQTISATTHPWLVAIEAPQDPGNVGAILRTIDAAGASGLVLLDGGVDPYHPSAVRASMGTIFHVPVIQASWTEFDAWATAAGYRLYGTSAHGRTDYRAAGLFTPPLVLLMGSEREGLSPEQVATCTDLLRLPMNGRARSLNLAVATGIFLYAIYDSLAGQGLLPISAAAR